MQAPPMLVSASASPSVQPAAVIQKLVNTMHIIREEGHQHTMQMGLARRVLSLPSDLPATWEAELVATLGISCELSATVLLLVRSW